MKTSSKKACPIVAPGQVFNNIELTKNQCENIGIAPGTAALGCGLFGCAYPKAKDPSRVIKITRDPSDVAALLKVKGKGLTPHVYDVKELKLKKTLTPSKEKLKALFAKEREELNDPGLKTPGSDWRFLAPMDKKHRAFVLDVEKVYPLSNEQADFLDAQEQFMHFINMKKCGDKDLKKCPFVPVRMPGTLANAKAVCSFVYKGAKATRCRKFVTRGIVLKEKLLKNGVAWRDSHAGNWGVTKNGKLVALDIGLASVPLKKKLKMLAGIPVLGE
jgi:hypothetical protein